MRMLELCCPICGETHKIMRYNVRLKDYMCPDCGIEMDLVDEYED